MTATKELEAQVEDLQAKLEAAELRAEAAEALAKAGGKATPKPKVYDFTEAGSHVANRRGYLGGVVIEADEPIPEGFPISSEWMREAGEDNPEDVPDDNAPKGKAKK